MRFAVLDHEDASTPYGDLWTVLGTDAPHSIIASSDDAVRIFA